MAFKVTDPRNVNPLYKFVSGELWIAITHSNLKCWEELKEFLKNMCIGKRTPDSHANQLVSSK